MKFSGMISTLSAIALFNQVSGVTTGDPTTGTTDIAELASAPMFWIGTPIPGGPEVRLTGTAKEILEQIKDINPEWEEAPVPTRSLNEGPTRVKRYFKDRPTCNLVAGGFAKNVPLFEEVIPYLWRLGATTCGAYRKSCSRVSCAWSSGVELCNDRDEEVQMRCDRIAGAAEEIRLDCGSANVSMMTWVVKGQWFDTTGYNVVIRSHNC
ncbi:hypothetical protein TWF730_004528 [Orbilia blumenaviensis]|uniref:Uncharacterized protein n=1 Tax=Orbilia blumenaviensis TaxID=1796055 RepID=A0AAV9TYQ4_9PEZI